jgi:hypothetical protein
MADLQKQSGMTRNAKSRCSLLAIIGGILLLASTGYGQGAAQPPLPGNAANAPAGEAKGSPPPAVVVLAGFFARHPRLRCAERPLTGRYGLVEKLEYGAVLWGNLVMIATGLILWRPDWFLGWTPTWTFDVCRVVHGFEATLAFLAIVIWHMYHVHLRPGVFPMSRTWLSGRISRAELRHHHTAQYLEILRSRRELSANRRAAEPPPGAGG